MSDDPAPRPPYPLRGAGEWRFISQSLVPMGRAEEALAILRVDHGSGAADLVLPFMLQRVEAGGAIPHGGTWVAPTWGNGPNEIDRFLQAAMDAAWERGLRPKGASDKGKIEAMTTHIEDLRYVTRRLLERGS